jgi:hypothetical protein
LAKIGPSKAKMMRKWPVLLQSGMEALAVLSAGPIFNSRRKDTRQSIPRELKAKGGESRFRKVEKGKFAAKTA